MIFSISDLTAPIHAIERALKLMFGTAYASATHTIACSILLLPKIDRPAPFLPD